MNLVVFWVGWALAGEVMVDPDPGSEVSRPEAPADLHQVWSGMEPDHVFREAVSRRRVGDLSGALDRFRFLQGQGIDTAPVNYQLGIALESSELYEAAVSHYEKVAREWPGSPESVDARFRRALCLEDMGRHRESLAQVRELSREGKWDEHDRLTLQLEQGIAELGSRRVRRGLRRVQGALSEVEGTDELTWMRAKAHTELAQFQLAEAGQLSLDGNRRAARSLVRRGRLLLDAERQVTAVALLKEPEFVLEGMLLLGEAYELLYRDMMSASPPRQVSAEEVPAYLEQVHDKASVLPMKAWRYYDEGLQVAIQLQWLGSATDRLRENRDRLSDALGLAPEEPEPVEEPTETDRVPEGEVQDSEDELRVPLE
ncbi:MAG: tetratricopeptide repeat protein [Myxococcota bacterium]|jgi:tetratricopeptide (TPR) repeat protein|nr:tetratricopeptide repeat protein [Myxococcota bacterium]